MSKEAARAFYDKVKTTPELAEKVTARGDQLSDDDIVKIAAVAGFECTVDELDAVGMEIASELNEDQLDAVTGGTGPGDGSAFISTAMKVKTGMQNIAASAYKPNATKGTTS